MTNKKTVTRRNAPARPSTKLDAATLQNMAHRQISTAAAVAADSVALQPVVEMLTKLLPSNLHLVENIIRVIVDEQTRDSD